MRSARVGLLLVLIATIGSGYLLAHSAQDSEPPPAPKTIAPPQAQPDESSDDSHSQFPQRASDAEVIGVPMLA